MTHAGVHARTTRCPRPLSTPHDHAEALATRHTRRARGTALAPTQGPLAGLRLTLSVVSTALSPRVSSTRIATYAQRKPSHAPSRDPVRHQCQSGQQPVTLPVKPPHLRFTQPILKPRQRPHHAHNTPQGAFCVRSLSVRAAERPPGADAHGNLPCPETPPITAPTRTTHRIPPDPHPLALPTSLGPHTRRRAEQRDQLAKRGAEPCWRTHCGQNRPHASQPAPSDPDISETNWRAVTQLGDILSIS
jgi:hypothetical protein